VSDIDSGYTRWTDRQFELGTGNDWPGQPDGIPSFRTHVVAGLLRSEHIVRYHKVRDQLLTRNHTVRTIYVWKLFDLRMRTYCLLVSRHFFWDLVPQVGSASSIEFICELIKSKQITDFLATGLLITFPYHVKYPNEKLLKQSEILLSLGMSLEDEIRKVAILSFASLVHKTCGNGMCSDDTQNNYIKLFLDKFKGR